MDETVKWFSLSVAHACMGETNSSDCGGQPQRSYQQHKQSEYKETPGKDRNRLY